MCMSVNLYMYHMCARCPRMSEEGDSLELDVDGCELLCGR